MYFVKPINHKFKSSEKVNEVSGGTSLRGYYRAFGFLESVEEEKITIIKEVYQKYPNSRFLADIASSTIKHFFNDGFLNKNKFRDILECLQTIICDLGYKELTDETLAQFLNVPTNKTHNIMMIAGCQNPRMLDARVDKALEIAIEFYNNLEVVASGIKPQKKDPWIKNESVRIINLFTEGIKKHITDKSKRPRINKISEDKSINTKDNIKKFFEGNFLKQDKTNQIIIVSSTSHLIRLSSCFEEYIHDNKVTLKYPISNLILAGAEGIDKIFFIDNDHLLKHMMLEIYDYLLCKRYKIGKPNGRIKKN